VKAPVPDTDTWGRRSLAERSKAYANMKRALLAYVRAIPAGRVVEMGVLADSLNIPARHAAWILTRLSDEEEDATPWHRVVPTGGVLARRGRAARRARVQIALLRDEGLPMDAEGRIPLSAALRWEPPATHRATVWAEVQGPGVSHPPA
jgi:methylated-DNA-protein-cysteine methyltransferase-like protein